MVRPICIYHTDFSDGGILILADEILLTKSNIIIIHSKSVILNKFCKLIRIKLGKACEGFNLGWYIINRFKGFGLFHGRKAAFNRIYNMLFNFFNIFGGYIAIEHINLSGANKRTLPLG